MSENNEKCSGGDELIAGPDVGNGVRPFVRHSADHCITGGLITVAREGQPCNGRELVKLTPIEGSRYSVETLYDGTSKPVGVVDRSGPSKVVTNEYRSGWDRIFGCKPVGQA